MFDTVLVANRGEIAVRVIRTLRRLGIRSVAVYSDADAGARHVREADDAVRLGPPPARESYLDIDKVLDAAARTGAQAIHPGYGFLSENAAFAAACERAGLVFIGPAARAIEVMGDKIAAKNAVAAFGVPVVPGVAEPGLTDDELVAAADEVGYPVLVKPSAGGGGKGMRLVRDPAGLPDALVSARREAPPRSATTRCSWSGSCCAPGTSRSRCSPTRTATCCTSANASAACSAATRRSSRRRPRRCSTPRPAHGSAAAACNTARSVDYVGAGTVEFIVSADRPDEFFFMEMNTRLQVEHPVTEAVTGLDLVEWQLRVAAGEKLAVRPGRHRAARPRDRGPGVRRGPGPGLPAHRRPGAAGARALRPRRAGRLSLLPGTVVGSDYDPMLSKVIAHGSRPRAGARANSTGRWRRRAVLGVQTNIEFLRFLLADERVRAGDLDTALLDERLADFAPLPAPDDVLAAGGLYRQWAVGPPRRGQPVGRADRMARRRRHRRRCAPDAHPAAQRDGVGVGTPRPAGAGRVTVKSLPRLCNSTRGR